MTMRIGVYPERCVGCRLCSLACSMEKFGQSGLRKTVIWVAHFGEESRYVPDTCTQCDQAWCVASCPKQAIEVDPESQRKVVNVELCNGCRKCTKACPFGLIVMDTDAKKAIKCDECFGDPVCVKFCPVNAITWEDENAPQVDKRHELAAKVVKAME